MVMKEFGVVKAISRVGKVKSRVVKAKSRMGKVKPRVVKAKLMLREHVNSKNFFQPLVSPSILSSRFRGY